MQKSDEAVWMSIIYKFLKKIVIYRCLMTKFEYCLTFLGNRSMIAMKWLHWCSVQKWLTTVKELLIKYLSIGYKPFLSLKRKWKPQRKACPGYFHFHGRKWLFLCFSDSMRFQKPFPLENGILLIYISEERWYAKSPFFSRETFESFLLEHSHCRLLVFIL